MFDPDEFLEHWSRQLSGAADPARQARETHLADLALAWSCAVGIRAALAEFERRFAGLVTWAIRRSGVPAGLRDEIEQAVRERLLVASEDGSPPKLALYSGRGPLASWLRAVTIRCALNVARAESRLPGAVDDDAAMLDRLPAGQDGPDLDHMRRLYSDELSRAFAAALGSLPDRDRNLLRLYWVDGLTIDRLAVLFQVHRTTCFRRLLAAQDELARRTRDGLRARLRIGGTELDSIFRLIRSQFELSLRSCFGAL
jgi:RNA polymerase sigma-70 factor (ECF subfamily)